jgi:hypothetical protein
MKHVQSEMMKGYTIFGAPSVLFQMTSVLTIIHKDNVADYCRRGGEKMLAAFKNIYGENNVRGISYCVWIDDPNVRQLLPIVVVQFGRILPRQSNK